MISIRVAPEGSLMAIASASGQLGYAVSLALNRVANQGQAAEREHIKKAFKLRQEGFVLKGIKIDKADRATKTSWRVVIQLAYPNERHFLDQHEPGGERVRHGGGRLWQPNQAVFKSKIIGRANPLHPKNLHLHKDAAGRIIGDQRTFLVRTKSHQVLILQRVDRGLTSKSKRSLKGLTLDNVATGMGPHTRKQKALSRTGGTQLLYRLVSKVRIPARLEFASTISTSVQATWEREMHAALVEALRGAK